MCVCVCMCVRLYVSGYMGVFPLACLYLNMYVCMCVSECAYACARVDLSGHMYRLL